MNEDEIEKDNNNVQDIIKKAGGARVIHSFLISKGYKINIDSIYKWKNNGIPHRYKALITILLNEKTENTEVTSTKDHKPNPEIISNIRNLNKFVYLVSIVIISFIIFFFEYKNQKQISNINQDNIALKQEIIELQQNIKNNYDKEIQNISLRLKSQSDINISNEQKINEISKQYNDYKNILTEINSDNSTNNFEELNNIIKYNESLIYLFLLRDNFYNTYNPQKINSLIEYINNYKLDHNLAKPLSIVKKLEKSKPKSNKDLIDELKIILNQHHNQKELTYNNSKYQIFNKIRNLVRIKRVDNINNSLLIENMYTSLINKDYEGALYLIESNKITASKPLDDWIRSIKELKDIKNSINEIVNSIVYKG